MPKTLQAYQNTVKTPKNDFLNTRPPYVLFGKYVNVFQIIKVSSI